MRFVRSDEFIEWLQEQSTKVQGQVEARFLMIANEGHFGTHKRLNKHISELKFSNGNRIYYTIITVGTKTMFVIFGGNKNGQQKDINKATKVAEKIKI